MDCSYRKVADLPMANEKIFQIMAPVSDMAKAKTFYAEKLGFEVAADFGQGDFHWVTLVLPGEGPKLILTTVQGDIKPGWTTFYISTANIEELSQNLKAKGVVIDEIRNDLLVPGSGVKWFTISDPDENKLIVAQL